MKPKSSPAVRAVVIESWPIELCQFLKFAGASESGGEAKQAIVEGLVKVNGVVEKRKRKKLAAGDEVTFGGEKLRVAAK